MTGMSIASGAGSHVLAPLTAATVLRAWQFSPAVSALLLAAGVLVAGLAWAFTWYLAAVAVLPLAIAGGREAFARRHWGP